MAKPNKRPRRCVYPASNATSLPILEELAGVAQSAKLCSSFYLDTVEGMSNKDSSEEKDHHQGIARTHVLSDGSVYFFLAHAEVDDGDQGTLSVYRYTGPLDGAHIVETRPLTVAAQTQSIFLDEQHPSDICFLPDVDNLDAGYLFVTQEYVQHRVSIYRFAPSTGLVLHGHLAQGFPEQGPQFVFIDQVDGVYYLGVASNHWGWGALLSADKKALFPKCKQGTMDISAFKPDPMTNLFPFPPLDGPCQVKLVRDSLGKWYLLAFTGVEDGADYVDVYGVQFAPFMISNRIERVHIVFKAGHTGFSNTGTHYVEPSGRLLVSSSYRWAMDEGPGKSSYVSRVDECPSK